MSKKEKKPPRYYNGIQIDSDEEEWVLMWLEELMERNLVERVERAVPFKLSDPIVNRYKETVQLKTKEKNIEKKQTILEGHEYTPEFMIKLTDKGERLLSHNLYIHIGGKLEKLFYGRSIIYIEVKPEWDQNNMERLFKINQKWVMEKYGEYVNLIKPIQLFEKTFVPEKYKKTATGKPRVIHIPVKSADEWIKTIEK